MDTNDHSSKEMESPVQSDQQQPIPEDGQNSSDNHGSTMDANLDRIELSVRYEESDILRDGSRTQTPIDNEPSSLQLAVESPATTSTLTLQEHQDTTSRDSEPIGKESKNNARTRVICVRESEVDGSESIEFELEDDNCLLLTSLTSLFPDATGLKFRHPETNTLRGVKLVDGKFTEPIDGWSSVQNYICAINRGSKRKTEHDDFEGASGGKRSRADLDRLRASEKSDLIVNNLSHTTTEDSMRTYFEQYGEVAIAQVKTFPRSGKPRGFGFVRFKDTRIHSEILDKEHLIDGRLCHLDVAHGNKSESSSRRIFVGGMPDNVTTEDLRSYFSEFGTLTDITLKPARHFAFVTFETSAMAQTLLRQSEHKINGTSVEISLARPMNNSSNTHGAGGAHSSGSQPVDANYGAGYMGNVYPFSYGMPYGQYHQANHHYHGKNGVGGNFAGHPTYGGSKMHQRPASYYPMTPYGPTGGIAAPTGSFDETNIGYNQASLNEAQYYKMQQQQPVTTLNHNHNYPNSSPYSNNGGADPTRGSPYGSAWKPGGNR